MLLAAVALSCGGGRTFAVAPNPDRNVLLVTIDTLRADALGSYGGRAATPNLDALAARGARFTFAHAHAVVTLVSHASILTGRYPYEHGLRDNTGYRLAPDEPTVATRLKARGFATGAFVGGFPLDRRFGLTQGFDRYDDRMTKTGGSGEASERERPADAVVSAALAWIGAQAGKWFTWVHLYDPHEPYEPPDRDPDRMRLARRRSRGRDRLPFGHAVSCRPGRRPGNLLSSTPSNTNSRGARDYRECEEPAVHPPRAQRFTGPTAQYLPRYVACNSFHDDTT